MVILKTRKVYRSISKKNLKRMYNMFLTIFYILILYTDFTFKVEDKCLTYLNRN